MASISKSYKAAFQYDTQNIQYTFWTYSKPKAVDTVIFLGSAQTKKIPKWVAAAAPKGVVVVDGLPHWHAHPTGNDLKAFSHAYAQAAYLEVLRFSGKKRLNIIGMSQGAPGVVWVARSLPNKVGSLGIVMPLGLTMNSFGNSPATRLQELKRRTYVALLRHSSLRLTARGIYIIFTLLRARFAERHPKASDNKYAAGLSYDLRPDCKHVLKQQKRSGNTFTVFVGEKDIIFPSSEVGASLKEAGLTGLKMVVLPGVGHISFVSKDEAPLLRKIVARVRRQTSK